MVGGATPFVIWNLEFGIFFIFVSFVAPFFSRFADGFMEFFFENAQIFMVIRCSS